MEHDGQAEVTVDALIAKGVDHYARGELEQAVAAWEEALRLDPGAKQAAEYRDHVAGQLAAARPARTEAPAPTHAAPPQPQPVAPEPRRVAPEPQRGAPERPPAGSPRRAAAEQRPTPALGVNVLLLAATLAREEQDSKQTPVLGVPIDLLASLRGSGDEPALSAGAGAAREGEGIPEGGQAAGGPTPQETREAWALVGGKVLELTRPLEELRGHELDSTQAFILSRIDGALLAEEICDATGLRPESALVELARLVRRGLVRLR